MMQDYANGDVHPPWIPLELEQYDPLEISIEAWFGPWAQGTYADFWVLANIYGTWYYWTFAGQTWVWCQGDCQPAYQGPLPESIPETTVYDGLATVVGTWQVHWLN